MKSCDQKNTIILIFLLLLFTTFTSCVTYKKIPYFKDVPDSSLADVKPVMFAEPLIQYDDILSIAVSTLDLQSSSALNMPTTTGIGGMPASVSANAANLASASTLALPAVSSYRVNKEGNIDVPLLGKILVSGLTTNKVKDTLQKKFGDYFKMPTVDVRFTNFRVTVLGEVLKPGTFAVPNEKLTILDALGLAGDLTIFGKRENLLLIRDSAGIKKLIRLNLTTKSIVASPYFYLKQNDVLYIEPTMAKVATLDAVQNRYIALASGVLSLLIIFATRKF